jgi:hypothetical protein
MLVPNELGVPDANNSNVVPSDPVNTSSAAPVEPVTDAPTETPTEAPADAPVEAPTEAPADAAPTEAPAPAPVEAPTPEEPTATPTADYIKRLHESQQFEAGTEAPDIFDDYGNIDPTKFATYQSERDSYVFNKALEAVNTREQAQQAESAAWEAVHANYAEIKDSPALENALRGARIQDISAGGDGDLSRLAKEIVAPFREAKIKATEAVNKTVEEAETLETIKPTAVTPPAQAPSLMAQLNAAIANGDTEQAQRVRHAIRKARIDGIDK